MESFLTSSSSQLFSMADMFWLRSDMYFSSHSRNWFRKLNSTRSNSDIRASDVSAELIKDLKEIVEHIQNEATD